jgi:hypothetical protein
MVCLDMICQTAWFVSQIADRGGLSRRLLVWMGIDMIWYGMRVMSGGENGIVNYCQQ